MPPEKPAENKNSTTAQRNAELILNRLSDYLSTRFDQATRINPLLKVVKQDLIYHELVNVRRCLVGEKIYGPSRMVVADVFLGDDEKRRRGLMSPTDQTSVQVELVSHCQDERTEATRGQIRIHDLKTFYASINPSLADLMDLVETWIWWDILDSAELVRFEQKLGVIALVRQGRFPEELRKRYMLLIQPAQGGDEEEKPASAITNEDVIRYEIRQLLHVRDQWAQRRTYERGYMYVLRRDEMPGPNQGEIIRQIAVKVREYDSIDSMDEINEEIQHRYALDLKLPPDKVTKNGVIEFLQNQLLGVEREMLHQADHDAQLGSPYNYKERQLDQMDKWLYDLNQQIRGVTAKPVENAPPAPPKPASTPAA